MELLKRLLLNGLAGRTQFTFFWHADTHCECRHAPA